jgi:hypothetical protein
MVAERFDDVAPALAALQRQAERKRRRGYGNAFPLPTHRHLCEADNMSRHARIFSPPRRVRDSGTDELGLECGSADDQCV